MTIKALEKLTIGQTAILNEWHNTAERYDAFGDEPDMKKAFNARGKIFGYIAALKDLGVITDTEGRTLYIYFTR